MAELMERYRQGHAPPVPEEAYARASREVLAEQRRKVFGRRCPDEFAVPIERQRMKAPASAVDRALSWSMTSPGLWLWSSATGQGKTRVLWELYRIAYTERGKSICELTGQQWADEVWQHHMAGTMQQLWGWLMRWDLLVLDDLDKANLTDERQARAMRELLDVLYRGRVPAVVTANRPPSWITEMLGQSAGRRAAEAFTAIRFE